MNKSDEHFSFTLPKSERLSSKIEIEELFSSAVHQKNFPLRVLYLIDNELNIEYPKLLVSVSKKKFKLAKDRNLLKRRIKEAYRLNKHLLKNVKLKSIGIIYVSNRAENFKFIEEKLILTFNRLIIENA